MRYLGILAGSVLIGALGSTIFIRVYSARYTKLYPFKA